MGTVWFVGAGPRDPDLITVKGRDLITRAGAIPCAGSLVSRTATRWAPGDCEIADSKGMTLAEIGAWLMEKAGKHDTVARLQTGDPGLYGALIEMVRFLEAAHIEVGGVPGVSSAMASAAAVEGLTLPEVTQTVILSRIEGRTSMPKGESLEELARHHRTLCLFLSITLPVQDTARSAGGGLAGGRADPDGLQGRLAGGKDRARYSRRHRGQMPRRGDR
uniref:Precorrin-4/cobalt-precorrin-4 C11-methyltransferase n=1 Tax=Candidatus Kentrum sp. FW TaxID=2126338 RepID=A0A450TR14_9GAMM|nr:MAG: precorrin-4/cobalt-precorrin-4 C11-methyltransferase [Candidatus Kentron sp. FW]